MITLDGKTLDEFGLTPMPGHEFQILAPTVDRKVTIPLRFGAYDFGADLAEKEFTFPLAWAKELSRVELQKKIREFAAFLVDSRGRPRDIKLVFDYEPDKWYTVRYAGQMTPERLLNMAFFELPMVAHDPFAYAVLEQYDETYDYDTGQEYDSGLIYPNKRAVHDWTFLSPNQMVYMGEREWAGFAWTYSRHMSSQYNHSATATPLIIEIAGNVTNPKITNTANDQWIQINTTLTNQVLRIDGRKKTVTIDGTNALKYMSGDFIDLEPGENGFFFDGTAPYCHVTYLWEHKFV